MIQQHRVEIVNLDLDVLIECCRISSQLQLFKSVRDIYKREEKDKLNK